MKKKAIISELVNHTMNYGNRLQSYALNKYLSMNNSEDEVYSLMLNFEFKTVFLLKKVLFKINSLIRKIKKLFILREVIAKVDSLLKKEEISLFEKRLSNCQSFTERIETITINNLEHFQSQNFDTIIVGSDIVWKQDEIAIDRLRFLNFNLNKSFKKLSYAASFGENWLPKRNKKYIKKCLDDFDAISVREKSSIELLESIGVKDAIHVCDPTLLLTAEEWSSVSEPVKEVTEKYIFVYLLGKDKKQREAIKQLAKKYNLKIATIPHANNVYDSVDDYFGDYKLMDAGPENWLWLIENAEYVITDSFHGSVFSIIFSKKFLVTKRYWEQDINMRMADFLDTIDEQEKFVDILSVNSLENFVWDYEKIHKKTDEFIEKSKEYLEKALTE